MMLNFNKEYDLFTFVRGSCTRLPRHFVQEPLVYQHVTCWYGVCSSIYSVNLRDYVFDHEKHYQFVKEMRPIHVFGSIHGLPLAKPHKAAIP